MHNACVGKANSLMSTNIWTRAKEGLNHLQLIYSYVTSAVHWSCDVNYVSLNDTDDEYFFNCFRNWIILEVRYGGQVRQ